MTQATFGPAVTLDGPLPTKPRYTLLDAATVIEDDTGVERWANGAQIWGYWTAGVNGFDPCGEGSKHNSGGQLLPVFGAFTAYKQISCSSRTFVDWETFERRGMAVFNAVESMIVENQLWEGNPIGSNPYLSDGVTGSLTVLGGAVAQTPIEGLALLEFSAASSSLREYMIHASYALVSTWVALRLVEREGNHLVTGMGTRIVTGGGYYGYGPAGYNPAGGNPPSSTIEWAYATGPIAVHRGPALFVPGELSQALDQSQNEVTGLFERDYLVYWDTGVLAACPIDRSLIV